MASFLISGGYLFRIHAWWWERHDLHPERIWVDENRSLVWCCHWMTRIWIHLLQRTFSHKNPSFLKDNWQGKYEYDEDYYHHYYYDGDTVTAHLHASKSSNSQSLQNKKKESQLGGMPSWKARSSSTLRRSSISSLMVAIWISDAVCGRLTCPEQSGKVPQQHGQWRSMQITFKKCGKCTRVKFHTMQRIKSLFQLWNITLRQPSVDWKHVLNNQDTRT